MELLNLVTDIFYKGTMVILALLLLFALGRCILGPKVADRVLAVNMAGTQSIIFICVLALYLHEEYLLDVAVVYALLSFLAVVVLTNVYLTVHNKNKAKQKERMEQQRREAVISGNSGEEEHV